MQDELIKLIEKLTRELSAENDIEITAPLGADTRLFGEGGLLDSISLVSLVVAIEQSIEERYGRPISLADEKALSQRSSPYRTIGALASYAAQELAGTR